MCSTAAYHYTWLRSAAMTFIHTCIQQLHPHLLLLLLLLLPLADCAAGWSFNAAGVCTLCAKGMYCPGGDAASNPGNAAFACPPGLTTIITGAMSQGQVRIIVALLNRAIKRQ
jgi:hypothetical protein